MKTKVFLSLAVVFSLLSLLYFTGCTAGTSGSPNSTSGAGVSILSGYVYKPAEGQSKDIKAAQNTGIIASSGQLNDANYTPVKNAAVKREDSPRLIQLKPIQTGVFLFQIYPRQENII